jgi:CRISPR system Cascade subunit CasB
MTDRSVSRMFIEGDESSGLLISWWEALDQDRGERATLRRAADPSGVVFGSSFHMLLGRLRGQGYPLGRDGTVALAAVAGLVAHVKSHVGGASIAQQMATPKSPGAGARVSGLRFRRLLAVSDRNELYPLLLRVVRLLDGHINLVSLANAAFWWNERTRQEWAYDYYATAPPKEV